MNPNTGEIVKVPEGGMEKIERALGLGPPGLVLIPPEEYERVRKMSKERRKAWAKSRIERRVRQKRERRARKEGRKGRSR